MNSEMMAKLRGLIEEAANGECNMTAEGKSCPVHENEQCPGYVEESLDEGFDENATLKRVRGAAKKVELSNDANAAKEFARQIDTDLTDLFQWYDSKQQTENKEKIRSLIKANKAAEQNGDLKHANTVAEVLLDVMRSSGAVSEDIKPAGISDELAAKKIASKIAGTPGLNMPKIKQYVTKYLSMVGKAPTDVDHLAALVSTELENKGVMESNSKPDFLDLDKDGNKKEPMKNAAKDAKAGKKSTGKKGGMSAKQAKYFGKKTAVKESREFSPELLALMQKYGVMDDTGVDEMTDAAMEEDLHITVDGPEAQDMINRLMALAGQEGMPTVGDHADMPTVDDHVDMCDDCGCASADCTCGGIATGYSGPVEMSMGENIDHDFGHTEHSDMGEPVDPDTYMYKAPVNKQRMVKGVMGDNPLIKEDADALGAKLKKDYKRYVAEAELARSNAGDLSPLSKDNREKFDIDPFAGDTPVTDGSHSPLSTVKRQAVNK